MYDQVNVLFELERFQVAFDWAGETEIRIRCPFHEDDSPSCNVSTTKNLFICHATDCGKSGDIVTLLAQILKQPRVVILEDLASRYDLDEHKVVEPHIVEQWHDAIWKAGPLLSALYERGITDDLIIYYRLGCEGKRITIPIPNTRGDIVNVRKYLPGAPGPEKMKNQRGRGAARLFPIEQLKYDTVMLCGGEIKAIVAANQLNKRNIGAICATQGEKVLIPEHLAKLSGKSVPVCLDIDATGRTATELNCRALQNKAAEIFDILLPLDITKYPKGDINDYIAKEKGDLWPLIEQAELWQPSTKSSYSTDEEPDVIHLAEAANAKHAGKRVAVTGIVTAMDTAPYSVPQDITVKCDKSMGKVCPLCPVFPSQDGKFTVPIESPAILEVVSAPKRVVHDALMGAVGIPRVCRVCSFDVETYYNAEDARLSPQLEITNRAADQRMQPAVCIGKGLELNEPYKLVGRMFPHPQTQQATLLISNYEPTRDALSNYETKDLEQLDIFRPNGWTLDSVTEKLDHIYHDLSLMVTNIHQRQNMHLAVDLVYHSPLLMTINNSVEKGWTDILIVGDSAQGKSEVPKKLMAYYELGEKVECKNATVAGLLGGLQQTGNGRWFVTWGFIPRHDRRMLFLDELKGASVETIGRLTDLRSSGIASLPKIEKQQTHGRTRMLSASNPRPEGRTVSSYNYGIEVIRELIGGLEDIRRYDMCLIVSNDEVDGEVINRLEASRNGAHSKYTSDLCRGLILWAWTRTPNQVIIDKKIGQVILDAATDMCKEYSDIIPIVDRGSMRLKLARLSAALAARTFSASEDRLSLDIKPCHIEYIVKYLREVYSTKAFGYKEFSDAINSAHKLLDPLQIMARISASPFPYDLIDNLLRTDRIELQDLQDWEGSERVEANTLLGFLVRKHALRREGRSYRKTGLFIEFLRKIQDERKMPDRPAHLPVVEF